MPAPMERYLVDIGVFLARFLFTRFGPHIRNPPFTRGWFADFQEFGKKHHAIDIFDCHEVFADQAGFYRMGQNRAFFGAEGEDVSVFPDKLAFWVANFRPASTPFSEKKNLLSVVKFWTAWLSSQVDRRGCSGRLTAGWPECCCR